MWRFIPSGCFETRERSGENSFNWTAPFLCGYLGRKVDTPHDDNLILFVGYRRDLFVKVFKPKV